MIDNTCKSCSENSSDKRNEREITKRKTVEKMEGQLHLIKGLLGEIGVETHKRNVKKITNFIIGNIL